MKYILEKSAVLSFVALKIIVFSALIFVITGCGSGKSAEQQEKDFDIMFSTTMEALNVELKKEIQELEEQISSITPDPKKREVLGTMIPADFRTPREIPHDELSLMHANVFRLGITDWEQKYIGEMISGAVIVFAYDAIKHDHIEGLVGYRQGSTLLTGIRCYVSANHRQQLIKAMSPTLPGRFFYFSFKGVVGSENYSVEPPQGELAKPAVASSNAKIFWFDVENCVLTPRQGK